MAQLWATGPAYIYVGYNSSPGSALFLCTCKAPPDLEIQSVWKDVRDQLGGDVAFDRSYQGKIGQARLQPDRLNFPVLEALACTPNTAAALAAVAVNGAVPTPGLDLPGDIGTLAITEGEAYLLYVLFPYFNVKAAMTAKNNLGLPVGGYVFPACMTARESPDPGTDNYGKALAIDMLRSFDSNVKNVFGIGAFELYSTDIKLADMPALN